MVGHGGSSASSYLADPTSPIPSHCTWIVVTSTLRVNTCMYICPHCNDGYLVKRGIVPLLIARLCDVHFEHKSTGSTQGFSTRIIHFFVLLYRRGMVVLWSRVEFVVIFACLLKWSDLCWPFNQLFKPFSITYHLSANNTESKYQFVLSETMNAEVIMNVRV